MKVKEFIQLLKKINPEADISLGNFTYYLSAGKNIVTQVNIDGDEMKILGDDKKRDLKKVESCVIWGSE